MSKDFENLDPSKMSPADLLQALKQYRAHEEANAFPAWDNTDPPYVIGDAEPLNVLQNAEYLYLLSDTKMGRPAVMEFDYSRYILVTLKRNLVCDEEHEWAYLMTAKQNKIKLEDLYLYKCNLRFIKAQMHNFKCDKLCLIDAEGLHTIYKSDLID